MKTNNYFQFASSDIFLEDRDPFNKSILRVFKENSTKIIIYIYIYRYDFTSDPIIKQIYFTNEKSFFFLIRISRNKINLINRFYNHFVDFIYNKILSIKNLNSFNKIKTSNFIEKISISDNIAYMDIFDNIDKIDKSLRIENLIKDNYNNTINNDRDFINLIIKFDYNSIKKLIIKNNPEIDKTLFDEMDYILEEGVN